jgi:hypothetical protein
VLQVLVRLVADPHRPHAAEARQAFFDPLTERGLIAHAVERLEMAAVGHVHEIAEVAEVAFKDVHRAQAVERLDHVIGVPQPAVAIVPVAARG